MPGTYTRNKFDIAGFSLGVVEKEIVKKSNIKENDIIMAVPSGLHSNGYSMIRNILEK